MEKLLYSYSCHFNSISQPVCGVIIYTISEIWFLFPIRSLMFQADRNYFILAVFACWLRISKINSTFGAVLVSIAESQFADKNWIGSESSHFSYTENAASTPHTRCFVIRCKFSLFFKLFFFFFSTKHVRRRKREIKFTSCESISRQMENSAKGFSRRILKAFKFPLPKTFKQIRCMRSYGSGFEQFQDSGTLYIYTLNERRKKLTFMRRDLKHAILIPLFSFAGSLRTRHWISWRCKWLYMNYEHVLLVPLKTGAAPYCGIRSQPTILSRTHMAAH